MKIYQIFLPQRWQKLSFGPTLQPQAGHLMPSCSPQKEQYRWSALCAAPHSGANGHAVFAQMINVAVFCKGDEPRSEGCAAAGVKLFDTAYHLEKGLLRQVLRKRLIGSVFQKEAGNVVVVQADELVKCLPFAPLTALYQCFFVHRLPLLLT